MQISYIFWRHAEETQGILSGGHGRVYAVNYGTPKWTLFLIFKY